MKWFEYMMFITWVVLLVLLVGAMVGIMSNGSDEPSDEFMVTLEKIESQNLSVSDMGRLYFECIKYCMDERGSGSNGEYRCLNHCENLVKFT